MMIFKNRKTAAHQLVKHLQEYKNHNDVVVAAIPRGSLPMGEIIAHDLNAPLDIVLTKKIGAPYNPELAIGAVSLNNYSLHPQYVRFATPDYIAAEVKKMQQLLRKRYQEYKGKDFSPNEIPFKNKIVIVVDDGIATGRTFIEAIQSIRNQQPHKIIAAVPVIPRDTIPLIQEYVDELIYLEAPTQFHAVGQFYEEFPQVSDQEAIAIVQRNK